jgi:membrane protein DedA with SNARE-associated domain
MEQFFDQLINFLNNQNDILLYLFLFLSAIVENLCPPIPGDTITAFGAFLVGTGRLNFFLVLLATTLGSVIGFMALFFSGIFLGKKFFINKDYKFFPAQKITAVENWFSKYGYFIVIINRFLPGFRSVISIACGISKLNIIKVTILCTISAVIWNLIWMAGGYFLGDNWDIVKEKLTDIFSQYSKILIILLGIALIVYITVKVVKRLKKKTP